MQAHNKIPPTSAAPESNPKLSAASDVTLVADISLEKDQKTAVSTRSVSATAEVSMISDQVITPRNAHQDRLALASLSSDNNESQLTSLKSQNSFLKDTKAKLEKELDLKENLLKTSAFQNQGLQAEIVKQREELAKQRWKYAMIGAGAGVVATSVVALIGFFCYKPGSNAKSSAVSCPEAIPRSRR